MAPLVFRFGGNEVACDLRKVERSQLYGYTRTDALDAGGKPCRIATLADDGRTLIESGGTAFAMLTPELTWCDKASLKPVDAEGKELKPVASSFKAPIENPAAVGVDELLSHTIHACYLLAGESLGAMRDALAGGRILSFEFSYRGGLAPDTAFLLLSPEGDPWILVGKKQDIRFVGLEQAEATAEESEVAEEEDDGMDFGMM